MKSIFKCCSLLLALILLFSFQIVKADGSALSFISLQDAEDTVDYAISRAGKSYTAGYCLKFVTECWTHTYGNDWPTARKCCAYKSWCSFKESTSLNDIPDGATVYFKDTSGKITYCGGHAAGHAGIYVGNDEIVHVWSGKIVKTSIKYVEDCGYKCLGWGYPSGIKIETEAPSKANSKLTINLTSYPTKLTEGSSYGLRGTITSNYKLKKVTGVIHKLENSKYVNAGISSIDDLTTKSTKSIDIASANLNKHLTFSRLKTGRYRLTITATDISDKEQTIYRYFDVNTLNINLTTTPNTLTAGKGFGLRGDITSVNNITKVCGFIKTTNGTTKFSSVDSPNSKSMNIRYSNLNNKLTFGKLSPGSYLLQIRALDIKGNVIESTYQFVVQ